MKKFALAFFVLGLGVCLMGCHKKQAEETPTEPMPMDTMAPMATQETKSSAPAEVKPGAEAKVPAGLQSRPAEPRLDKLPPSGPYRPSNIEIQTALKNAGFYTGKVDGNLGKMSKKAIEAFQKSNGLHADGRVGPRTWEALKKYLETASAAEAVNVEKPAKKI